MRAATDKTEAIREPAGNVCRTVVGDGQRHAGERRQRSRVLPRIVDVDGGAGDFGGGHVQQRGDANLDEPRSTRGVPAASEVQPWQQLHRVTALCQTNITAHSSANSQHSRCTAIALLAVYTRKLYTQDAHTSRPVQLPISNEKYLDHITPYNAQVSDISHASKFTCTAVPMVSFQ